MLAAGIISVGAQGMVVRKLAFVGALVGASLLAGGASAASQATPELPHCGQPVGTVAIQEPQRDWWTPLGLSNPEALLKLMAGRSNCLRVVARGQAMQMRQGERALGDSGELQRGQNFGGGQVVAADYFLIPDIVDSNNNAGGASLGGLGRAFGSRFGPLGSIAGSISIKSSTAQTLLTLVNARTTEQEYVAEGAYKKTDVGFGGGGGGWDWGLVGGGYANTDIGRVISLAYINAFSDLIGHLQGVAPGTAQASAPIQSYTVTDIIVMRSGPSPGATRVRDFKTGDLVYPTGQKNGVWWEVDDENGNRGWVASTKISPRR
jgi:hypothetical protein